MRSTILCRRCDNECDKLAKACHQAPRFLMLLSRAMKAGVWPDFCTPHAYAGICGFEWVTDWASSQPAQPRANDAHGETHRSVEQGLSTCAIVMTQQCGNQAPAPRGLHRPLHCTTTVTVQPTPPWGHPVTLMPNWPSTNPRAIRRASPSAPRAHYVPCSPWQNVCRCPQIRHSKGICT